MLKKIYFGTYTRRLSKGIYCADFDTEKGKLSHLTLVKKCQSPTHPTQMGSDWFSLYGQEDQSGLINLSSGATSEMSVPRACYLSADPKRDSLYTANYHTGKVHIFKVDKSITEVSHIQLHGHGPHRHQEKAHPHFAALTPDNLLLVCDLGSDTITTYSIYGNGTSHLKRCFSSPAGSGPRQIVFHPRFKIAFVVCELSSTVQILIYNGAGDFEPYQELSTLPLGFSKDANAAAAIALTKDGRYLYVSNCGHNSIACYTIERDGYLTLLDIIDSHGDMPRDITLSPDDNYLLVAHQESDNISVFKRQVSGHLQLLSNDFFVPETVRLTFEQDTVG